jgi:hypothetical protein
MLLLSFNKVFVRGPLLKDALLLSLSQVHSIMEVLNINLSIRTKSL